MLPKTGRSKLFGASELWAPWANAQGDVRISPEIRCRAFSARGPRKSRQLPQDRFFVLRSVLTVPGPVKGPPEAENGHKPPVVIFSRPEDLRLRPEASVFTAL